MKSIAVFACAFGIALLLNDIVGHFTPEYLDLRKVAAIVIGILAAYPIIDASERCFLLARKKLTG